MPTNTPAPRRDHDGHDIAAVPVAAEKRPFNWLYLTPLLLLLLVPFCHRRDDPAAEQRPVVAPTVSPVPVASPAPLASPAASVADRATDSARNVAAGDANATRNAGTTLLNPFTVHATGPDANKAVLNFDANATTPNTDATGVLRNVVAYLQANPDARVSLKGFTDNSGPADTNKRLTQQRIDAVRAALTAAGVDAGRIAASNFGEAYPVTDNSTAQAREMNRRVEVELAR